VGIANGTLGFVGFTYIALGAVMGLSMGAMFSLDPEIPPEVGGPMGLVFGVFTFVLCAGFGAVNFLAMYGLSSRSKWGWILTLVLGGIYLPSGCLPFGALLFVALFNEPVRKRFLG
jgi:hypothetical protein